MHLITKIWSTTALAMLLASSQLNAQSSSLTQDAESTYADESFQQLARTQVPNTAAPLMDTVWYESFGDSLDGWTVEQVIPADTLLWVYWQDARVGGRFAANYPDFESASAADGYMQLNYDTYNTNNTEDPGVLRPVDPVNQSIISPSIDISGQTNGLAVQFYHFFRYCCNADANAAFVAFSTDGGATFTNETQVEPNLDVNAGQYGAGQVNIPAAVLGATDLKLRFRFAGTFYLWAIDDILITERPANDLTVTEFFARAGNESTPSTETSAYPMVFVADVENNGGSDQDVRLAVEVRDVNDVMIYTDTIDYGTIASDADFQNNNFPNSFPMPTELGTYTGTYTILGTLTDMDFDSTDNQRTFNFTVSEDLFSKSGTNNTGGVRPSATNEDYGSANIYLTPSIADGDTIMINQIDFSTIVRNFENTDEGFLEMITYGFRGDLNGDGLPDYESNDEDSVELVELAVLEYQITSDWPEDSTFSVAPSEDGALMLPFGENFIGFAAQLNYIAVTGASNDDNTVFTGTSGLDPSGAYSLATDSVLGAPIVSHILAVPSRTGLPAYTYFGGNRPYIDATIQVIPEGAVSVPEVSSNEFSLRPNPVSTNLIVELDLDASSYGEATYAIRNAIGQQVFSNRIEIQQASILNVDVNRLNQGLYYLELTTKDGRRATRKFMVK